MSPRAAFRQVDLVRALKAAGQAGLKVQRFEIDPDGRIVVVMGEPENHQASSALEAWKAKRARRAGEPPALAPKGWDDVVGGSWHAGSLSAAPRRPKR